MPAYTPLIQNLIDTLAALPGIGPRSAERIVFHLLKQPEPEVLRLAEAIRDLRTRLRRCVVCHNFAETERCSICSDDRRDPGLVCVVEQPKDLLALESSGHFGGVYHVLLGRLSPLEGVTDDDLTIAHLLERLRDGKVREVILATNPTVDGDGTADYVAKAIKSQFPNLTVSRIARGLAAGSSIENANRNVLADALRGRRELTPLS